MAACGLETLAAVLAPSKGTSSESAVGHSHRYHRSEVGPLGDAPPACDEASSMGAASCSREDADKRGVLCLSGASQPSSDSAPARGGVPSKDSSEAACHGGDGGGSALLRGEGCA